MTLTNAINKATKKLGVQPVKNGIFYEFTVGKKYLSFCKNGGYDEVCSIAVGRVNDRPDSMTDYFPEVYFKTITAAIKFIIA